MIFGFLGVIACLAANPVMAQFNNVGDDSNEWADGAECNNGRFTCSGLTSIPLLEKGVLVDAPDCRAAFETGQLTLVGVAADGTVDFGNDSGKWSKDDECDGMRLAGKGTTETLLLHDQIVRDTHPLAECR